MISSYYLIVIGRWAREHEKDVLNSCINYCAAVGIWLAAGSRKSTRSRWLLLRHYPQVPSSSSTSTNPIAAMNLGDKSNNELLFINFNQDFSCISVGTKTGYRIYNCEPYGKCYSKRERYLPHLPPTSFQLTLLCSTWYSFWWHWHCGNALLYFTCGTRWCWRRA